MGFITVTDEFDLAVSPSRMFKAIVIDANNILPKLSAVGITHMQMVQGDGSPGSIKEVKFAEGSGHTYAKEIIDEIDEANYFSKYTLIEADEFSKDTLESITYEVKFDEAANRGCVCKITTHFRTNGDFQLKEEDLKVEKEAVMLPYKTVEAYLLANPDAYL